MRQPGLAPAPIQAGFITAQRVGLGIVPARGFDPGFEFRWQGQVHSLRHVVRMADNSHAPTGPGDAPHFSQHAVGIHTLNHSADMVTSK
jgi:hypothetical protein